MIWIVYIAAALAVIITLYIVYKIIKGIIRFSKEPLVKENAEVVRMNRELKKIHSGKHATNAKLNEKDKANHYVTFKLDSGKIVTFMVSKKLYCDLEKHQTGLLHYRGFKFIDFSFDHKTFNEIKKNQTEMMTFFGTKKHDSKTVEFYGEAKELDVNYHSNQTIKCDQIELIRFINQLVNQKCESFFVIEDHEGQILEVSNQGDTELFDLVYMNTQNNERYIGDIKGTKSLELVIDSFFKEEELVKKYELKKEN